MLKKLKFKHYCQLYNLDQIQNEINELEEKLVDITSVEE